MVAVIDQATGLSTAYTYDVLGNRTSETLTQNGSALRAEVYSYNSRGWLTGVDASLTTQFGPDTLVQPIHLTYRYDSLGNRVLAGRIDQDAQGAPVTINSRYLFDANGRMVAIDDLTSGVRTQEFRYDGYGNQITVTTRTSSTDAGSTLSYHYNLDGEVLSGSDGEVWQYDAYGNETYHHVGATTTTSTYDADGRLYSQTVDGPDGQVQSVMRYDDAGNLALTGTWSGVGWRSSGYGFDEVTYLDVRYQEQAKVIANSWTGAAIGRQDRRLGVLWSSP
jgi:YD repeat-containing protein